MSEIFISSVRALTRREQNQNIFSHQTIATMTEKKNWYKEIRWPKLGEFSVASDNILRMTNFLTEKQNKTKNINHQRISLKICQPLRNQSPIYLTTVYLIE